MNVSNVEVYGLAESIFRSGYPMRDQPPTSEDFHKECSEIKFRIRHEVVENEHMQRAFKLAKAPGGGHDQFLTGIHVNFDLTFSNKAWVEAERYTFLNFISSMSTMHRISKFNVGDMCNDHVLPAAVTLAEELRNSYNNLVMCGADEALQREAYLVLLYNLPSGFELMAGMTTNYRCLKNICAQRRYHRLPEWREFCRWIETLPLASRLLF